MLSFVQYTSAVSPAVRLRNASRQYWDFVALTWVASENANTRVNYGESVNGDGTSLYTVDLTLPAGGPFVQEAVLPSSEVIAYDSTILDRLTVPDYVGPVIIIAAPPSPDQQTLYGSNKEFGSVVFSSGDTITMTLVGKSQGSTAGSILEPMTRTATVAVDGSWSLTPDKGAYIKVTASNTAAGIYFTKELTVDEIDIKNILDY